MKLLTQLCLVVLLVLVTPAYSAPPNIVILFVDDLGYADIGPFGATMQKTPNLDRMAREGMKLTSFYAAPVCSVSRAQLMTGCYGARVSVPGVYGPGSKNGLHPQERTIAEYLKEKGYATQIVGKWHLGDQPEFLPTKQGFDHYLGIPYSNDMQKTAKESGQRVVPLVRDDKVVELLTEEDQSRIEERYTEEAVGFIRANQKRPFFLYFPHTAVHTPIHPGKAFQGRSENGRFGDWVEEVDWSVGRVLDTLRELKLEENTLVVFTSDNGPWLVKGQDGGSALPLRGGKGSTWEGGVREPSLAWWPGKIAPGSVCDAVAGTIDLLPTCVKLAGGTVPAEPVIDGRDISPLLFGQTKESQREAHYYFSGWNLQAVRQGAWKLALVPQSDPQTKGIAEDSKMNPRLYNLDEEIDERTNLADKHPEIVQKLQALATRMSEEIGGSQPKARRPAGEVENPQLLYPSNETGGGKKKAAGQSPFRAETGRHPQQRCRAADCRKRIHPFVHSGNHTAGCRAGGAWRCLGRVCAASACRACRFHGAVWSGGCFYRGRVARCYQWQHQNHRQPGQRSHDDARAEWRGCGQGTGEEPAAAPAVGGFLHRAR